MKKQDYLIINDFQDIIWNHLTFLIDGYILY